MMFNLKPSEKQALVKGWSWTLGILVTLAVLTALFGPWVWMILMFGCLGFCIIYAISSLFIEVLADEDDELERADRLDLYRKQQRREQGIDPDC
jgi:biopolymer transport protein ExbB/TolQ